MNYIFYGSRNPYFDKNYDEILRVNKNNLNTINGRNENHINNKNPKNNYNTFSNYIHNQFNNNSRSKKKPKRVEFITKYDKKKANEEIKLLVKEYTREKISRKSVLPPIREEKISFV